MPDAEIQTFNGAISIWYADHRRDDRHDHHREPDKPTLLLIHGAAGSHLDWSIGLRKRNGVVPDLPGHGKSSGSGYDSVAAYAADMIAFMDALKLDRAVIAGHSMGGAIAQTMALDYAERVRGLILIGTGAYLPVNPTILRVREAQAEVGTLLKKWFWAKETPENIRQRGYELFMQTPAEVTYGDYVACNTFDVRDRVGEIQAPTLVIGGAADKMTPPAYSEFLAANIPNATLVLIPDGSHMMAIEQPERVVGTVDEWLKERS